MTFKNMKKLIILILSMGFVTSCGTAKSTGEQVLKIEMSKTGMSGYVNSTFTPEKFKMEAKGVGAQEKISKQEVSSKGGSYTKEWVNIVHAVSAMDLTQMNTWESPTNERLHDGADVTFITIKTTSGEYQSLSFDEGKPPAELEKLYSLLENVVNQ